MKEQTRWENVADRKEPITDNMVRDLCQPAKDKKIDSLENVIADWTTVGMCRGAFRPSEWAQNKSASSIKKTKQNLDRKPAAFVLSDFVFHDKKGRHLKQAKCKILREKDAFIVSVRWHAQKNRNNGKIKKIACNDTNPVFCAPQAALRIQNRAMKHKLSDDQPMAMFMNYENKLMLANSDHIDNSFQASAE